MMIVERIREVVSTLKNELLIVNTRAVKLINVLVKVLRWHALVHITMHDEERDINVLYFLDRRYCTVPRG